MMKVVIKLSMKYALVGLDIASLAKEEFWSFLEVIINRGIMPLSNLQEYWSRNNVSNISFYSKTFTRDKFSKIFWILGFKVAVKSLPNIRKVVLTF